MSDRLKQLQHQRTLLQEHLTWLEQEIAKEQPPNSPTETPATVPTPVLQTPHATPEVLASDIIAQHSIDHVSLKGDVKKGCFLYFFVALAVVGICVLILYIRYSKAQ